MPRSQSSHSKLPVKTHDAPAIHFKNPYSSVANTGPTFGQTVKEGLAFGTGQAVAHRMIGSIFGGSTLPGVSSQKEVKLDPCEKELYAFQACLKSKNIDDFCGQEQINYRECIHEKH